MKKKYLTAYKKWLKKGVLPEAGLCKCLGWGLDSYLHLLSPPTGNTGGYWGYWGEISETPILSQDVDGQLCDDLLYKFGPLRQNIVLLMAAMNGEL